MLWTALNSSKFPKSESSFCLDSHLLRMQCFFVWQVPPVNMKTLCFIYIFQGSMAVKLETNLTASLLKKHAFKKTYLKGCSPKKHFCSLEISSSLFRIVSILKHAKNDAEMGSFVWRAGRSYETGRSVETHLASIHIREIAPLKRSLES